MRDVLDVPGSPLVSGQPCWSCMPGAGGDRLLVPRKKVIVSAYDSSLLMTDLVVLLLGAGLAAPTWGPLIGDPKCRLSILRNGNVPCRYFRNVRF